MDFEKIDRDQTGGHCLAWHQQRTRQTRNFSSLYALGDEGFYFNEYSFPDDFRKAVKRLRRGVDPAEVFASEGVSIPLDEIVRVERESGDNAILNIRSSRWTEVPCSNELCVEMFFALRQQLKPTLRFCKERQRVARTTITHTALFIVIWIFTGLIFASAVSEDRPPKPGEWRNRAAEGLRLLGQDLGGPLTLLIGGLLSCGVVVWAAIAIVTRPTTPVLKLRQDSASGTRGRAAGEEADDDDVSSRRRRRQPAWHQSPAVYVGSALGLLVLFGGVWLLAFMLGQNAGPAAPEPAPPQAKVAPPPMPAQPPINKQAVNLPGKEVRPAPPPGPPKITGVTAIDKALADLEQNENSRRLAAEALAKMPPGQHRATVAAKLAEHLNDNNIFTRRAIFRALRVWATHEQVPALISALDNKDFSIRNDALGVLGGLADQRAVVPVVNCFVDVFTRREAASALIKMGTIAELQVLPLLDHKDRVFRKDVVNVLKEIGTERSLPALTTVARSNDIFSSRPAFEAIQAIQARARGK